MEVSSYLNRKMRADPKIKFPPKCHCRTGCSSAASSPQALPGSLTAAVTAFKAEICDNSVRAIWSAEKHGGTKQALV